MLRAVAAAARASRQPALVSNRAAFATATAPRWGAVQQSCGDADGQHGSSSSTSGSGSRRVATSDTAALAVQRPSQSLLRRTVETALDAFHRLALLLSSMKRLSANEAFVARFLQRRVGLDSFALEYLHVTRPALFRLSVAREIDPVVSWLRSVGISGEELAELVRHTPGVLSLSVDEQLEPLASFISAAKGSPSGVLHQYPNLAAVPMGAIKGTWHVLRQLGVADSDISLLLLCLPDMYAQLAHTLQRLFTDLAVAGWKLHMRQRRQYAGMVHHQMSHWNRRKPPAAAAPSSQPAAGGSGRHASNGSDTAASAVFGRPADATAAAAHHRPHVQAHAQRRRVQPGARAGGGLLLSTSYHLLDHEVYLALLRVQAALETVPLAEGDERDAAIAQLQHAIDMLGDIADQGNAGGQASQQA